LLIRWYVSTDCDVFFATSAISNISIHRNITLLIHRSALKCLLWFANYVTSASYFALETACVNTFICYRLVKVHVIKDTSLAPTFTFLI
jgi:hypothetical protein